MANNQKPLTKAISDYEAQIEAFAGHDRRQVAATAVNASLERAISVAALQAGKGLNVSWSRPAHQHRGNFLSGHKANVRKLRELSKR